MVITNNTHMDYILEKSSNSTVSGRGWSSAETQHTAMHKNKREGVHPCNHMKPVGATMTTTTKHIRATAHVTVIIRVENELAVLAVI